MAEIVLTRPDGFKSDRLRAYQIYVDRQKVGQIKPGETEAYDVPPGQHELQLKIDWGTSETLLVDLAESDRARFVCGPRVKQEDRGIVGGYRLAYWMTLGSRRYIDLRPGDELPAEAEPEGRLHRLDGPKLFGIALVIGIAYWALTGQEIAVVGVLVAGMAWVVGGLIGRGIGKGAVQATEEVQDRRASGSRPTD